MDPDLIHLIDQLHICKELNENAQHKLMDTVAREKVDRLLAKKNIFVNELSHVLHIDISEYLKQNSESINLKHQKAIHQFEDLFLNGNDAELISFLISTENKLQKIYVTLTEKSLYDDFATMIIENQLSESRRDMMELNKLQEEYI